MLPFVFNFIGFLISVIEGFEEIYPKMKFNLENIDKKELEEVFETKNMKTQANKNLIDGIFQF